MTADEAVQALRDLADPKRAPEMAAYHKIDRPYLGCRNGDIDALMRDWRKQLTVPQRVALSSQLWDTNIYEARLAASKLLTQARIRPDDDVWNLIVRWVPSFDSWAIADHACMAGHRRLVADPDRLDEVETWVTSEHMWTRRAALVITLPWTKQNHPKPQELQARDRILGWAATYVQDRDWFIQKSVAWWLRELSKHDAPRVLSFMAAHGEAMKPFARKEALRKLPKVSRDDQEPPVAL